MKTNSQIFETIQFKILSTSMIEEIVNASFEILESVGVTVYDDEILKLLEDAGCIIREKRAFIPSFLVKYCLSTTPSKITISNRDGETAMVCTKSNIHFGAGPTCVFILDSYTGERRKFLEKDIENGAIIADYLSNLDFHMSMGLISDRSPLKYDRYEFFAMLKNTNKPLAVITNDEKGLEDVYNMSCIITEGETNFRLKPFFMIYAEPVTPLTHLKEGLRILKFAAKKGIPNIYTPCPIAGATTPVTLASSLSVGIAECLSGVVFAQLVKKGAPIICGGVQLAMDMHTGVASYGSTEFNLMSAAMTEIYQYLEIPVFSTCGCSSSKIFDAQASLEAMYSTMIAAFSGANIIHDIGYLEDGLCGSYEQLVLTNEIIGMVKRFISGIKVNSNTIALDIIKKVGPGGNFLSEEHTLKNFKNEIFTPELIDRNVYQTWKNKGSKSLETTVNEKVKEILKNHKPQNINDKKLSELNEYMEKIKV